MGWFDKEDNDRTHQDSYDWGKSDRKNAGNTDYQYCHVCQDVSKFKWDRCTKCGSN